MVVSCIDPLSACSELSIPRFGIPDVTVIIKDRYRHRVVLAMLEADPLDHTPLSSWKRILQKLAVGLLPSFVQA